MEDLRFSPELLEFMTQRMRHAVSNGQYLTTELLEETLEDYQREAAEPLRH